MADGLAFQAIGALAAEKRPAHRAGARRGAPDPVGALIRVRVFVELLARQGATKLRIATSLMNNFSDVIDPLDENAGGRHVHATNRDTADKGRAHKESRMITPNDPKAAAIKVPAVTLVFWVIKIAATTLGETAGDAVSMSMNLGYLVGTAIFGAIFIVAVLAQIRAKAFHAFLYWGTIVATTTVGTTLADFADRSLHIGYAGGATLLLVLLLGSLFTWQRVMGSVSIESVTTPKAEAFYWTTIMFSQTLGTALGDWTADTAGRGYLGSAAIFSGLLAITAALYFWTKVSRTALFWAAFILTRPLGAVVGDFLDKPRDHGGLALSRYAASAALLLFMAACILLFKQKPAERAH